MERTVKENVENVIKNEFVRYTVLYGSIEIKSFMPSKCTLQQ